MELGKPGLQCPFFLIKATSSCANAIASGAKARGVSRYDCVLHRPLALVEYAQAANNKIAFRCF